MKIERKSFSVELKFDGDTGRIKGFGSVYGNVDNGNDIVMPNAFAKCIARMKAKGQKPKMLWQHKTDMPIGIWDVFEESMQGLLVEGSVFTETAMGKDAYVLLKGGAINGLSIGYGVRDYSIDSKSGTRLLKELELYEVSLVTFPMNEMATVTSVKSVADDVESVNSLLQAVSSLCVHPMSEEAVANVQQMIATAMSLLADDDKSGDPSIDKRSLEKYLCDAGLSRSKSKAFISGGFKAMNNQREADDNMALAELSASLLNSINTLKGF